MTPPKLPAGRWRVIGTPAEPVPVARGSVVRPTIPLAWRVRFPVATVAVITAAEGLLVAVAAPHQAPFAVFIGSVLASYSLGAHTAGARRWPELGVMFAIGVPFMAVSSSRGMATGNTLAPLAWLTGAWAVGAIICGRRLRTAELELLTGCRGWTGSPRPGRSSRHSRRRGS